MDASKTFYLYRHHLVFRHAFLSLKKQYLTTPINTLCRWGLRGYPNQQVQGHYGETSVSQFDHLLNQMAANGAIDNQKLKVYELGCGRGELAFWLATVKGFNTVGVELNSIFVERAQQIKRRFNIDAVEFIEANMMALDYRDADFIYVYGTGFSEEGIQHLQNAFLSCQPGTLILTTSYSLNDIDSSLSKQQHFLVIQQLSLRFSWGLAEVFLHRKQHRIL